MDFLGSGSELLDDEHSASGVAVDEKENATNVNKQNQPKRSSAYDNSAKIDKYMFAIASFLTPYFNGPLWTYEKINDINHSNKKSGSSKTMKQYNTYYCCLYSFCFIVILTAFVYDIYIDAITVYSAATLLGLAVLVFHVPYHTTRTYNGHVHFENLNHTTTDAIQSTTSTTSKCISPKLKYSKTNVLTWHQRNYEPLFDVIQSNDNYNYNNNDDDTIRIQAAGFHCNVIGKWVLYLMISFGLLLDIFAVCKYIYHLIMIDFITGLIYALLWAAGGLVMQTFCVNAWVGLLYYQLVCYKLLADLKVIKKKIDNACGKKDKDSVMQSKEDPCEMLCEWYEKQYKPQWVLSKRIILQPFYFTIVYFLLLCALMIWVYLSQLLDIWFKSNNMIKQGDISLIVFFILGLSAVWFVIGCLIVLLCENTNYYFQIKRLIDKIMMDKNKIGNVQFWLKTARCKKGVLMHPMNGSIYGYTLSWWSVFRITVVFMISKLVIYLVTLNFQAWNN